MVGAVLSLFLLVTKRLYGKEWEWSIGQIKTCRKKQHVKIDDIKEMSDLICGKAGVIGNLGMVMLKNLIQIILHFFQLSQKRPMIMIIKVMNTCGFIHILHITMVVKDIRMGL